MPLRWKIWISCSRLTPRSLFTGFFQECLTNISKHAGATEVSIAVTENDGLISLVLEDNGAGFDPSQVAGRRATGRGMGLAALDERARMLGGTLKIRSQPGSGTRLTCVIPVDQGQEPRTINSGPAPPGRQIRSGQEPERRGVWARLAGTIRVKKV